VDSDCDCANAGDMTKLPGAIGSIAIASTTATATKR